MSKIKFTFRMKVAFNPNVLIKNLNFSLYIF